MVPSDQLDKAVQRSVDEQLHTAVVKEVTAQEDVRFKQIRWFIAIVGLIGLGTFGTVAAYVIEKVVDTRLERRTNNITQTVALSRFYMMAVKLDIGQSFSQDDVDAIMNYLRKVEKNSELRHSPEFLTPLLQVAKSFVSAGQTASIDELFHLYEREILAAPQLVQALLYHYGQEIVGREIIPKRDLGCMTFEKLERVATSSRVPGLALAYRTLYESGMRGSKDQEIVAKLIQCSTRLDKRDRARYLLEMLRRSKEANWVCSPTPESTRIESVVRSLFATHSDAFTTVYGLDATICKTISAHGVEEQEAEQLAVKMAESVSS
jgi:hypothetical protein